MRRSTLFLLISVTFWGFSYIAIKVVLRQLDPVEMISIRFLLASPVLFFIIKLNRRQIWPVAMKGKLLFAAGVIFLHFWVMATGMKETSATNTAWILTTAPIFVALLARAYLGEKFRGAQWGGLAVAVLGVFVLVYNGDFANLGWIHSRGDLIVLGSCVTWAIYTVGTRELTTKVRPMVATFWMVTLAGIVFVPYTFATTGFEKFLHLETDTVVALVFLGVFCLAIAFWLWSEGLKRQPAAEVGVYLYIEPLVTMVGAWVLLSERLTIWLFVGAALISLGVYLSERFGRVKLAEHDV